LVTSKKQHKTTEPKKSLTGLAKYTSTHPAVPTGMPSSVIQNSLVLVKKTANSLIVFKPPVSYSIWRTQYQNFKNLFPNHPWAGTLYGIKVNIPRNAVAFTTLPLLRDELEESFTPGQSKVIAGVGTGLVESLFTARARVIKTIMHTSKDAPTHKEVWAALPVVARGEKVKAAIKWGAAKGVAYWVTFPVLTQLFEEQFKQEIKHFQLGDSYTLRAADYLLAGAAAGAIAPLVSYPLDVLEKRAILNPGQNQLQKTWNYYCRYGLRNTIAHNTHVGFLKTALPRMMLSSALFNFTLHLAKSGCDAVFVKEEYHHKPSVVSPVLSSPANISNTPLPVVAVTPVAPSLASATSAFGKPFILGASVKSNSVVPVVSSALYRSNGFFGSNLQFLAANPKQAITPDAMRFARLVGPLEKQFSASGKKALVVTPASCAPVDSVKLKV
jgi:hypothetical protein